MEGKDLIVLLKQSYGVRTNSELAKLLIGERASATIGNWEKGIVTKTVMKNVLSKIIQKERNRLDGNEFISALKKLNNKITDKEISETLGLTQPALNSWKKNGITIRSLASVINKSKVAHTKNLITPITEFREIRRTYTSHKINYEIMDKSTDVAKKVKLHLDNCNGIYIFHDSRGNAVYVGKAKSQTLWKEMNSVF
jgi:hypothetical protein